MWYSTAQAASRQAADREPAGAPASTCSACAISCQKHGPWSLPQAAAPDTEAPLALRLRVSHLRRPLELRLQHQPPQVIP